MQGFVQGADRQQTTLLPECLDDWVDESNSIRAVDVFVDALELRDLGFDGVDPAATGRPAYRATGGVYLAGGIAGKILPALKERVFRESFRSKSPLEGLLARIPVRAVREPRLGLIGAAEAAYRTAIETTR